MSQSTALFVLLALTTTLSSASIVEVNHAGVYSGMTVKIESDVPKDECQMIVNNIQDLITQTSRQLFELTDGLGIFEDVTVILPSTWANAHDCLDSLNVTRNSERFTETFRHADFHVVGHLDPALYNSGGWPEAVLQYGQCGTSSRLGGIRIPKEALNTEPNSTIDETLANRTFVEWLHHRYGVFPEAGFLGDPMYPDDYELGDSVEVNAGCQDLTTICRDLDHYNRFAPTKQNLLCNHQAAMEVVRGHKDFHVDSNFTMDKIRNPASFGVRQSGFKPPSFQFVLPSETQRIILAIDLSKSMNHWHDTRNALFTFFSHIVEGTEVGIVTFGSKAKVNIEPTAVTQSNRHGVLGKIPFRLLDDEEGCVECGLKIASKLLTLPSRTSGLNPPGSIILITASDSVRSGSLKEVKYDVMAMATPVFSVTFKNLCKEVIEIGKYGQNYHVNGDKVLQKVSDAFVSIGNQLFNENLVKIFSQDYVWSSDSIISGNFDVEENQNENLWMILTTQFMEDVEIFEVTSPSGKRLVFPKYEHGLVHFYLRGHSEVGVWSFRAKLYQTAARGNVITVEVFAKSSHEKRITIDAWTNKGHRQLDATEDTVIIYSSLFQGQLPIRNAKVVAEIDRPGSSSAPIRILLRDDGQGYPDITSGDGIYSGYFTRFTSEPGMYSIIIKANHNSGHANVPKANLEVTSNNRSCCGSYNGVSTAVYSLPSISFSHEITGPSFHVSKGIRYIFSSGRENQGPEPVLEDIFPPSRVTDLSVESYVNNSLYAVLTWSAPGDDFNYGKAAKYEIRCYTKPDALMNDNFNNISIPVHESLLPNPDEFGTMQSATVALPWANEIFYYGLVSIDEVGNVSPVSNLIPAFAREVDEIHEAEDEKVNEIETEGKSAFSSAVLSAFNNNTSLYLIIGGIVCGLVIILALVLTIAICRTRRRSTLDKERDQRTKIFVNDIETVSANTAHLSDEFAVKKPGFYGEVWTTIDSGKHSPDNLNEDFVKPKHNLSMTSDQASWAYYVSGHYQPPKTSHVAVAPESYSCNNVPTYQNWSTSLPAADTGCYPNWSTNPPSDNGTATTSSTDCSTETSDRQSDDKTVIVTSSTMSHPSQNNTNLVMASTALNLTLTPSFVAERRRRQESLV